jgi:hypothetical protein
MYQVELTHIPPTTAKTLVIKCPKEVYFSYKLIAIGEISYLKKIPKLVGFM